MSDNLAERPENQGPEQVQRNLKEYEWTKHLSKERVEAWNANRGDLPEIVMNESSLQMDPFKLHLEFDQVPHNPTKNVLYLKLGVAPYKGLFGFKPPPVKHMVHPITSDDGRSIFWAHNLPDMAPFTTEKLAEFVFDMLREYYSQHKPKQQR